MRDADRILVLHEGRLIEHGSHDELMSQAGTYADLFALQAAAYATTPATPEQLTVDGPRRVRRVVQQAP